jgi:hypothetical protein
VGLSLIIFSVNGDNGKNALAQPLPNSYDLSEPNTHQSDIQLEDIINRQGKINEPEEIEPEVLMRTDGSSEGSGTVDSDNRNDDANNDANEVNEVNDYDKASSEKAIFPFAL